MPWSGAPSPYEIAARELAHLKTLAAALTAQGTPTTVADLRVAGAREDGVTVLIEYRHAMDRRSGLRRRQPRHRLSYDVAVPRAERLVLNGKSGEALHGTQSGPIAAAS
jgi:hypothetical protein